MMTMPSCSVRIGVIGLWLLAACQLTLCQLPNGTSIGPSTQVEPYMLPMQHGVTIMSLLTGGDSVPLTSDPSKSYRLAGIPDGMGIYLTPTTPDPVYTKRCQVFPSREYRLSESSTFTLLLNHEISKTRGIARRHGGKGAFVSEWRIDRRTFKVVSGEDLIDRVALWNNSTNSYNFPVKGANGYSFDRFCSADLPLRSAFWDEESKKGTKERIFMNGEETLNGKVFAHVATGPEKGISYEIARAGKGGWENQVACPYSGEKTVMMGLDDSNDGQVYVYIGDKQASGTNTVELAGLTNGKLYGIRVMDFPITASDGKSREPNTSMPMAATIGKYGPFRFELRILNGNGDVSNLPQIETVSDKAGVTRWARPEDGIWQPTASSVGNKDGTASFYFVTTASFTARSRLWRVDFDNLKDPLAGGTVTAVVEGSEKAQPGTPKMMDNLVATCDGSVYLQEDPGGNEYLARIWRYHPDQGLTWMVQHNPKFFQVVSPPPATFLTRDEESSGIIAVDPYIDARTSQQCFIVNTQAHYSIEGELVEGAQLMLMCVPNHVPKIAPSQSPIAP